MDKEFIHNLENGKYYILDFINQKVQQINSRGKNPDNFTPYISGFCNSKQRKLQLKYHNSISYTPHQNKYFGYCQCPNQKIKHTKVSINNNSTVRKEDIKQSQPINLTNCFNKPKTPKVQLISNLNNFGYKKSEKYFDQNVIPHLSGSLRDATQVYQFGSVEAMQYRRGTQIMNKSIKLNNNEQDQLRFTCRYLNNSKIKSPPYMVMQKFEIINRINQEQERKVSKSIDDNLIKRIEQLPHLYTFQTKSYHPSYQNVDISLSQQIDFEKIKAFISQR